MTGGAILSIGPATVVEVLIEGLGTAGVFVMIASGLTLIFGLMGVLNFAHGALTTVGAYVGGGILLFLVGTVAIDLSIAGLEIGTFALWLFGLVLTGVVLMAIGSIIEFGLIRKLYGRAPIEQILLTFGVALVIEEFLLMILGNWQEGQPDPTAAWGQPIIEGPSFMGTGKTFDLLGVSIRSLTPVKILLGIAVVIGVWAFLNKTRYGLFIRAGTEDSEMAQALGINVERVFTVVFGIGIGLAGMAGMFLIWERSYELTYTMGSQALLPAFIIVVVGGLGTFKGTVVASIIAGIFFEAGLVLSTDVFTGFSQLNNIFIFLLLVGVLILQPQGLYGQEEVGGH
ncbi:branched-chain amino acid ABC transporter permease [Halobacteriales archaeon Cl-PHB]